MGSHDGEGGGEHTTVTMEDLKNLETRLSSSLVNKVKKMLEQLLKDKDGSSSPSPQGDPPSVLPKGDTPISPEDRMVRGKQDNTNSSTQNDGGKGEHRDSWYSPYPPIPHPHVYNRGYPPKLEESATFAQWQSLIRTHMRSSCIELWNIIEHGLFIGDPNNMTRREVINKQLNATTLHMIQQGLGTKDYPHIEHLSIAKEAWDALTVLFVGNESMRRNRYDALSNEAKGFYMKEGEDHEDMYQRLKTTATAFRNVGASHVDDAWIKRKYVSALMPFEPTDLKSLQGRHNYHLMTSNEVMQEMAAFKVAAKNAKDARARDLGMSNVINVALKAKVVDHGDGDDSDEGLSMDHPDEVKIAHGQYMAFYEENFWKKPAKAKMEMQRSNPNVRIENVTKMRS